MSPYALILMLVAAAPSPTRAAEPFTARCTRVIDGDTIIVQRPDGSEERVRYAGIDAPELDRREGRRATALNRALVLDREIRLQPAAEQTDPYGRLLAHPTVCGIDVELALQAAGLARRWR